MGKFEWLLLFSTPFWRLALLYIVLDTFFLGAFAHVAAWHKGMYCLNGTTPGVENKNTNSAVQPLYQLNESDWWFHHVNKCDEFPPAPGDFLELPANGQFTVELAVNRAFTTLSYNGSKTGLYGDGQAHPGLGTTLEGKKELGGCISNPNIHTQNETMAAGTAFAISYTSNMTAVTKDTLVVFTVLYHTPWRRIATYSVPNLPPCPDGGCICAWGWVPNGCGQQNMYMQPYRCKVTGSTSTVAIAPAKPPVWCEDDPRKCVQGPKQMIYFAQLEGNNVLVSGYDLSGQRRVPTYNEKLGFKNGAQTDIFESPKIVTVAPSQTSVPFLKKTNAAGRFVMSVGPFWFRCASAVVVMAILNLDLHSL